MALTPKGRKLYQALATEHEKRVRQIMKPLSGDEAVRLQMLLDKLAGTRPVPMLPATSGRRHKAAANRLTTED